MKHTLKHSSLLLAFSLSTLSPVLYADWGVGLNFDTQEMRYKDNKNNIKLGALIDLHYQGIKLNLDDSVLSYNFTNSNTLAAEAILTTKNYGFKAKDSKTFKGMSERKPSGDIGGRVIAQTSIGPAVFDVTKDIGKSKGYSANFKLGGISPHSPHWTGEKKINVAAMAGVRYQSKKTIDYYYGVKKNEVTSKRKAYKGNAATTPYLGIEAQANLTQHVSLKGSFGMSKTAKSIRNSPLTNDKNYTAEANLGITYWF